MKTVKKNWYALVLLSLFLPINMMGQSKEVPVTTSSKEALKYFTDGLDKMDNIEFISATQLFDKAIAEDKDFALAYLYRSQSGGGFSVFRQNLDKAVSLAGKVSEGEKQEIMFLKAQADGDGAKQKQALDWLVEKFPSDKRVQMLAGEYYYSMNDFKTALTHFTNVTTLDKNYSFVYNMIGYAQSAQNNFPEAEKAFQTYIKLLPDKGNPYDSYGELLLKMGKYDESIAQYKMAVQKDPVNFAASLTGVGNNYIFKGDFETARKYFQEYYDKAPDVSGKLTALNAKALSFVFEGNVDKANSTLDEYRALAEKENRTTSLIISYFSSGLILSEAGKSAEGAKYFDKAQEAVEKANLPEATKETMRTFAALNHAYSLAMTDNLEQAKAELDKCKPKIEARKNPLEMYACNSVAGLYEMKKANYDQALSYFSKADSESPITWYYTALTYKKKGDIQNATKLFDKVTKYNVSSLDLAVVRDKSKEEVKLAQNTR